MRTSETIDALAAALVEVQPKLQHPKKNASNPHLRNKFADLNAVIDANRETLAKAGLVVVQTCDKRNGDNGQSAAIGVTTRLIHSSGQWVEGHVAVPLESQKGLNLSQAAGSIITYLRRYGWQTILGINGEPDDDGNEAKSNGTSKPPAADRDKPGDDDLL